MNEESISRRSFFQKCVGVLVFAPLFLRSKNTMAAGACPTVPPAGKPLAKPNEGMGKPLSYVERAQDSHHPKYKAGSDCSNCKFFLVAKLEGGYAPCTMMGMKYVTKCGWCSSYAAKD